MDGPPATPALAALLVTLAILVACELALAAARWRRPRSQTRSAHAQLRQEWFEAVSSQPGSELLAVQTLRNSLMSATMTASTAALALMGTASLALPSLHDGFGVRSAIELALLALLFMALVSSAMSVRYYHHAGFVAAMPVASEARRRWAAAGVVYVRRAGLFYSWGLRHLILVAPLLASMIHPLAGPLAAAFAAVSLVLFDRAASSAHPTFVGAAVPRA